MTLPPPYDSVDLNADELFAVLEAIIKADRSSDDIDASTVRGHLAGDVFASLDSRPKLRKISSAFPVIVGIEWATFATEDKGSIALSAAGRAWGERVVQDRDAAHAQLLDTLGIETATRQPTSVEEAYESVPVIPSAVEDEPEFVESDAPQDMPPHETEIQVESDWPKTRPLPSAQGDTDISEDGFEEDDQLGMTSDSFDSAFTVEGGRYETPQTTERIPSKKRLPGSLVSPPTKWTSLSEDLTDPDAPPPSTVVPNKAQPQKVSKLEDAPDNRELEKPAPEKLGPRAGLTPGVQPSRSGIKGSEPGLIANDRFNESDNRTFTPRPRVLPPRPATATPTPRTPPSASSPREAPASRLPVRRITQGPPDFTPRGPRAKPPAPSANQTGPGPAAKGSFLLTLPDGRKLELADSIINQLLAEHGSMSGVIEFLMKLALTHPDALPPAPPSEDDHET